DLKLRHKIGLIIPINREVFLTLITICSLMRIVVSERPDYPSSTPLSRITLCWKPRELPSSFAVPIYDCDPPRSNIDAHAN
ncbi:uncharacterized protein EI90DRAFT_3076610, partial [Cantharellus anzutake]|uniref:uncharacterized protein n=1 Tax=Cantharellus anzutake TaxID=1750568 RepID=UPI0019084327